MNTIRPKKTKDLDLVKYVKAINVHAWKHKQGSFQGVSPLHLAEGQWKDALHRLWYLVSLA